MLPQGCCSENTDKMGTGAMKAKILSLYACSFFWVSLLVIKKKKQKRLATLSTCQMKKHISRAPDRVFVSLPALHVSCLGLVFPRKDEQGQEEGR